MKEISIDFCGIRESCHHFARKHSQNAQSVVGENHELRPLFERFFEQLTIASILTPFSLDMEIHEERELAK